MRVNRRKLLLKTKIKGLGKLKKIISALRNKGGKVVFTNGCFDILHYGHINYLEQAKRKGDLLVVAVNSDASVKRIKGPGRPITNQKERANIIAALECVDFVTLFKEDTPIKVIEAVKPDVLAKGADWDKKEIVGRKFVLNNGGVVSTIKLEKGYSTTNIINKIAKLF